VKQLSALKKSHSVRMNHYITAIIKFHIDNNKFPRQKITQSLYEHCIKFAKFDNK